MSVEEIVTIEGPNLNGENMTIKYSLQREIGRGGQGIVFEAIIQKEIKLQ